MAEELETTGTGLMGSARMRGTGIPVEAVLESLAAEEDEVAVLKKHPGLTGRQIRAAKAWELWVRLIHEEMELSEAPLDNSGEWRTRLQLMDDMGDRLRNLIQRDHGERVLKRVHGDSTPRSPGGP